MANCLKQSSDEDIFGAFKYVDDLRETGDRFGTKRHRQMARLIEFCRGIVPLISLDDVAGEIKRLYQVVYPQQLPAKGWLQYNQTVGQIIATEFERARIEEKKASKLRGCPR